MSESSHRGEATASNQSLEQRVAALESETERLRNRVAELEEQLGPGPSTLPSAASDYRDARVLEALDVGDEPRLSTLRALYEERTDIRDRSTLRDRVEGLAESDAFDQVGYQRWRYLGEIGGRDE
jgi:hypothetical protein